MRQIVLTVAKEVQNHQAVLGAQIHAAGVVKEHQNHQAVPGAQIHAVGVVKEHQNLHHAQTVPAIAAADVMTAALTPAKEVVAALAVFRDYERDVLAIFFSPCRTYVLKLSHNYLFNIVQYCLHEPAQYPWQPPLQVVLQVTLHVPLHVP